MDCEIHDVCMPDCEIDKEYAVKKPRSHRRRPYRLISRKPNKIHKFSELVIAMSIMIATVIMGRHAGYFSPFVSAFRIPVCVGHSTQRPGFRFASAKEQFLDPNRKKRSLRLKIERKKFWSPTNTRFRDHSMSPLDSSATSSDQYAGQSITTPPNERAKLLNKYLDFILTPPSTPSDENYGTMEDVTVKNPSQELMDAALRSLRDPSSGYDPKYGRPALRCYRSFIYPKESNDRKQADSIQLEASAQRTANQIDFLIKRNTSKRLDAIRNHDPSSVSLSEKESSGNRKPFPITLVLDNLRGSFNVGSIFRTAEACGVSQIFTCGITPHPNGSGAEKVAKSALGAEYLVHSEHFITTRLALEELANREPTKPFVVALETTQASKMYTKIDYRPYMRSDDEETSAPGIALILGNEVTGVDAELMAHLLMPMDEESSSDSQPRQGLIDCIVELPTYGKKNSLNVAAVAPVILYELLRQWENDDHSER